MAIKSFNILKFLLNLFKAKNKTNNNVIQINFDRPDLKFLSFDEHNIKTIQLSELQRKGLTTAGKIPKVLKDIPPPPQTKWEIEKA